MKIVRLPILITFFFALVINASASNSRFKSDTLAVKAEKLKRLYTLATTGKTEAKKQYIRQFFNEFPNSFAELNALYGYSETKPAPLYSTSELHILKLFNNITAVTDTVYDRKLIRIAIGGRWDADAVNFFLEGLHERTERNVKLMGLLLKKLGDKDLKSFWVFYFDGPHPQRQIPTQLYVIRKTSDRVYKAMVSGHEFVLKGSDGYGK